MGDQPLILVAAPFDEDPPEDADDRDVIRQLDRQMAVGLLLERWSQAEVEEVPSACKDRHSWVWLNSRDDEAVFKESPDASLAMQVWRKLHYCRACDGSGAQRVWDGSGWIESEQCAICGGVGHVEPPVWLTRLDASVCERPASERWEQEQDEAFWAGVVDWVHHTPMNNVVDLLRGELRRRPERLVTAGAAILRERKRQQAKAKNEKRT